MYKMRVPVFVCLCTSVQPNNLYKFTHSVREDFWTFYEPTLLTIHPNNTRINCKLQNIVCTYDNNCFYIHNNLPLPDILLLSIQSSIHNHFIHTDAKEKFNYYFQKVFFKFYLKLQHGHYNNFHSCGITIQKQIFSSTKCNYLFIYLIINKILK